MYLRVVCITNNNNDDDNNHHHHHHHNNNTKTPKPLNLHKMLLPKADVERLYIPRKDGGRCLIEVETAFKTATMGLDHYLKHKEG